MKKVLVADDDPVSLTRLSATLGAFGCNVMAAHDGLTAWQMLLQPEPPLLVILDWEMPGINGDELIRRLRDRPTTVAPYIILLTARKDTADIVAGLDLGANDYLTKPYHRDELFSRVRVGWRVIELQERLAERVRELEHALAEVHRLQGLLPICAWCRKVRDSHDYWHQVDDYLRSNMGVEISHAMCPECWKLEQAKLGDSSLDTPDDAAASPPKVTPTPQRAP